jgi:hypothetical protein
MNDESKLKQERINSILGAAGKMLEKEGVKYFLGVVDRQPKQPNGGTAYAEADITGEDMCYILDMAFPNQSDLLNAGICIGNLIHERGKITRKQKKN